MQRILAIALAAMLAPAVGFAGSNDNSGGAGDRTEALIGGGPWHHDRMPCRVTRSGATVCMRDEDRAAVREQVRREPHRKLHGSILPASDY